MNLSRFKTKKVNTVTTVGERLKKKREEMKIPIESASERLKIKLDYLENLENNNYDKLPPDVYIKGFVRNYAELVGLDPDKMIALYNREKAIRSKMEKKPMGKIRGTKFAASDIVVTPRIVTIFFSLFFLSIIGYYFWYQVNSFNSTPYLFVSSPSADEVVNVSEITVEGETDASGTVKINGEDVFADSNGRFKENIALKAGKNTLVIEATNRFGRTAKEEINIIYEKKPEAAPLYDDGSKIYEEEETGGENNADGANGIKEIENIEIIGP